MIALFDNDELPMLDNVLLEPFIVLLVSVSVVSRATNVSVAVGSVTVAELLMLLIIGVVKVLFVNVCEPVNVANEVNVGPVKVIVSDAASVVIVIPVAPANVSVSVAVSATTFDCPATATVRNKY